MSFLRRCSVFAVLFWTVFSSQAQVSKGNQILIDRGLQIQGLIPSTGDLFHLDTYQKAIYSTVQWAWDADMNQLGAAPGVPWSRWVGDINSMPPTGNEGPYMTNLVALSLSDEPYLDSQSYYTTMTNWFITVKSNYPNTILYLNSWGGEVSDGTLNKFIAEAGPDMISFDLYAWQCDQSTGIPLNGPPTSYYSELRRYRAYALSYGIPFGTYRQTYHAVESDGRIMRNPSGSELRLTTSSALAFNCKFMSDFTYNSGASSLFDRNEQGQWAGDTLTNALYNELCDINLRARNLGKALVRLKGIPDLHNPNDANPPPGPASDDPTFPDGYTTSLFFIKGKYLSGGVTNTTPLPNSFLDDPQAPTSYSWWEFQKNDPYLNGWSIVNTSTNNNGLPGEVIISWFTPLDESFDGPNYNNEIYMMVVNALTWTNAASAQCSQQITLNFINSFTGIEMLNPATGIAEYKQLPIVNTRRQLVLNLAGGDAALFKFSDGAPFVGVSPVITNQPVSRTNLAGTSATFSVSANSLDAIGYQWQFNGADIFGANSSTYTRDNLQFADSGNYTVVLTNTFGSVTSAVATLTVQTVPSITTQPQSQTVNPGGSASFNVVANGNPQPTYQWRRNGVNIPGATTSVYSRTNVQSSDSGNYSVAVVNSVGTTISSNATLLVNAPPYITAQPQNAFVPNGNTATFSVTAFGPAPLTYVWQKDGNTLSDIGNISGSATATLTVANVQAADLGNYSVVVGNGFGATPSSSATLANPTAPTIQTQPASRATNAGSTVTFNVVASGGGLSYQWRRAGTNIFDGGNILGASSSTLTLTGVTKTDAANYTVVITNAVGSVTSSIAALTINYPFPWREPFNYSVGTTIANQTSPSYLVWADVGTSTSGPSVAATNGNLSIAGLAPPYGNSIQFGGLGKSARLSFPNSVTSGTLYYSFALKVADLTGASATGGFIAGFNNSTGTQANQPTVVGGRLYLKTVGGGYNLGIAKNSDTDWYWDSTLLQTNQTVFVVASYTFTTTGNSTDDIAKFWVNPSASSFGAGSPPTPSATASTGSDISGNQIASFVFFQRSATTEPAVMVADDLRIGTTWASVTPAIAPISLTSASYSPGAGLQFQGTGDPASLIIQGSADLINWIDLTNFVSTNGTFQYIDNGGSPKKFYRAKLVP